MTPLEAVAALAAEHRVRFDELVTLKDGSNMSVHLAPTPVVLRVATFTAQIRREPLICAVPGGGLECSPRCAQCRVDSEPDDVTACSPVAAAGVDQSAYN
jgi:hypothetical protein